MLFNKKSHPEFLVLNFADVGPNLFKTKLEQAFMNSF